MKKEILSDYQYSLNVFSVTLQDLHTEIKRWVCHSLSTDSDDEGAASYVPGESPVRAFSVRHYGPVASPYVSAYVYRTGNVDRDFGMRRAADGSEMPKLLSTRTLMFS